MSQASARKQGLSSVLRRRTYVVFVTREADMRTLRTGEGRGWTIPMAARPGDRVLVYKPGKGAGWGGRQKRPYGVFVAAGIVYGKPRLRVEREYRASLGEIVMLPTPVERDRVTTAFPEWQWLRRMRGVLGAAVPPEIEEQLVTVIDRLAFARTSTTPKGRRKSPK